MTFSKNKFFSIILLLIISLGVINPLLVRGDKNRSFTLKEEDIGYEVYDENSIKIIGYKGNIPKDVNLIIPAEVDGKKIKAIGDAAFSAKNKAMRVKELILPEGLEKIGEYAFYDSNISKLDIPDSVKEIGRLGFYNSNLEELKLGSGLREISENCFAANSKLKKLEIPSNIKVIKEGGFKRLTNVEELKIEEGLERVEKEAFSYMFSDVVYDSLVLPKSLKEVGEEAFIAARIKEVNTGGVEIIKKNGFRNAGIEKLEIGKNLEIIGEESFAENKIKKLYIPSNVKKIGRQGFWYNADLKVINFSEGLLEIGAEAFFYCSLEGELKLPSTLKTTDLGSFYGKLSERYPHNKIEKLDFNGAKADVIGNQSFRANNIKSLNLIPGAKEIKAGAFLDNKLEEVYIGDRVKHIGSWAFSGTSPNGEKNDNNISKVIMGDNVENISERAFKSGSYEYFDTTEKTKTFKENNFKGSNKIIQYNNYSDRLMENSEKKGDTSFKLNEEGVDLRKEAAVVSYEKDRNFVEKEGYKFKNFIELDEFKVLSKGKEISGNIKENIPLELTYKGRINEKQRRVIDADIVLEFKNNEEYFKISNIKINLDGKDLEADNIEQRPDKFIFKIPKNKHDKIDEENIFEVNIKGNLETNKIRKHDIRKIDLKLQGQNIINTKSQYEDRDTNKLIHSLNFSEKEALPKYLDFKTIYKTEDGEVLDRVVKRAAIGSYQQGEKKDFKGYEFLKVYPKSGQIKIVNGSDNEIVYIYRKLLAEDDISYKIIYKSIEGKILDKKEAVGKIGEVIEATKKDFKGYKFLSVDPKSAKIELSKEGDNEIIYYYKGEDESILNKDDHIAYIAGYPCGNVKPMNKLTREEAGAIICRILNKEYREAMKQPTSMFTDVEVGKWSCGYLGTLENAGLIKGYGDGTFRPAKAITRAELAVILANTEDIDIKDINIDSVKLNDIEGHWAEDYIKLAESKGWIEGYPNGNFRPDTPITRAEFIATVNRVLDRQTKEENMLIDVCKEFKDLYEDKWYYLDIIEATNAHNYEIIDGEYIWTELTGEEVY